MVQRENVGKEKMTQTLKEWLTLLDNRIRKEVIDEDREVGKES